jgi:hypothetical protein
MIETINFIDELPDRILIVARDITPATPLAASWAGSKSTIEEDNRENHWPR